MRKALMIMAIHLKSLILNNKNGRGELKALSYIAVKGLLYFASHDTNAIQLIEKAEKWNTGLDNESHCNVTVGFLFINKYLWE